MCATYTSNELETTQPYALQGNPSIAQFLLKYAMYCESRLGIPWELRLN